MKKLLAIALTVLMMVCAIIPAFAAEATAELPEGFEDAEVVNFAEQWETANEFSWSGTTCWPWNSNDFRVDGQFEALGTNTILLAGEDFVYNVEFTAYEDGAHALAVYLAEQTTTNGANSDLSSPVAGAFNFTLTDENGNTVGTYTLTEKQPAETGSRLYYVLAESVELAADTNYILSVQLAEKSSSCLVDLLVAAPAVEEDDTSADAGEDTSADAAEDTSADAAEDTSADAAEDTSADVADDTSADVADDTSADAGDDVAPETFDVALIALAVAGASAAVAVVSKKRR